MSFCAVKNQKRDAHTLLIKKKDEDFSHSSSFFVGCEFLQISKNRTYKKPFYAEFISEIAH